jgi:uncharacterized RmlC-like cupin family protein
MDDDLRVIRPPERTPDVASGEMRREAAVSERLVGAKRLWVGYVELDGGMVSAVHHHGEAESVIYLISGTARFLSGPSLDHVHDANAGDFVWVPPHVVHVEMNASDDETVRMVVARSTQETLVFNVPAPEGWMPPSKERPEASGQH